MHAKQEEKQLDDSAVTMLCGRQEMHRCFLATRTFGQMESEKVISLHVALSLILICYRKGYCITHET